MILQNTKSDIVIPDDVTYSEFILGCLRKHGDNIAMVEVDENRRTTTFRELHNSATLCAAALNKLGVKTGDVVAVTLGNRREFAIVLLATAACGGILTTCNPDYTEEEITRQFVQCRPKVVFVEINIYQKMETVAENVDCIEKIFTAGPVDGPTSFEEFLSKADQKDFPSDKRSDTGDAPFFLPYSSGTTGLPKGVVLTYRNMLAITLMSGGVLLSASLNDIYHLVLPQFNMFGTIITICCMTNGVKLIVQKGFTIRGFLDSVQEYKVTNLSIVPPMALELCNFPNLLSNDTSSLERITCGSAPLPGGVGKDLQKKLHVQFIQAYGMTEATPLTAAIDQFTPLKSVGRVCPNTSLKVVEAGRELDVNQSGEILAKGPQLMKGYYRNPQATTNIIDHEGWLHTGDIGYFNEHGQVFIIGRLKELIKVNEFQVSPAEIEELLLSHPNITDAAVIGVPDRDCGEAPKAFVVKNVKSLDEKDVHEYIRGKLSSYKHLKGGVAFCDVIPKSAGGKILRRELRDRK